VAEALLPGLLEPFLERDGLPAPDPVGQTARLTRGQ